MTILDRSNYRFFIDLQTSETLFRESYLVRPVAVYAFDAMLGPGTSVLGSDTIVCKLGTLVKDSYVWMFDEAAGAPVLMTTLAFLEVKRPLQKYGLTYVISCPLEYRGHNTWQARMGDPPATKIAPVHCILSRAVVHLDTQLPVRIHACL